MTQSALISLAVCFCAGAMWVRRKTWRIQWDRALTMSVAFDGLAFALVSPTQGRWLNQALFNLTGIAHLSDYFGHLLFICAVCSVIYAAACRLVPDDELEALLHKIEIPGAVAAAAMLGALTLSKNITKQPRTDFFDVPCDFWLRVYWATYGVLVIYLTFFMVRLLLVLRGDPRSRTTANMFLVSAGFGLVSFGSLLVRVVGPKSISCFWIWAPLCISGAVAAFAAAWSWRGRMRSLMPDWTQPTDLEFG